MPRVTAKAADKKFPTNPRWLPHSRADWSDNHENSGGGRAGEEVNNRTSELIAPPLHTTIHNMQKNGTYVQFKLKFSHRLTTDR
jgi:hypothetical protein